MTKITRKTSHCRASPSARQPMHPTASAVTKTGFLKSVPSANDPATGPMNATSRVETEAAYPQKAR